MDNAWVELENVNLCKTIVQHDFDHARELLEVSPTLINIRHPLGWAPLHVVILCGDPSLVKFVLGLPGLDITITDISTFNTTSSAADILCRQQEFCPNISGTESTCGATVWHFACIRGDWEIMSLLLNLLISSDVQNDLKRLALAYLDSDRVNLETLKAYETSNAWCQRSFGEIQNIMMLCRVISYDYCEEILNTKPELAQCNHPSMLTAVQAAIVNHTPPLPGSTPLHYACLLVDMKIVESLLRNGADWTIPDGNNLLPEDHAYKCIHGEKEELRWAGRFAEELELEREEELEYKRESERKKELERKKMEFNKELQRTELEYKKALENKELCHKKELKRKKLEYKKELECQEVEHEKEVERRRLKHKKILKCKQSEYNMELERRELEYSKELECKELEHKKELERRELERKELERKELERKELERLEEELRKRHTGIENIIGDKVIGQRGPIRSIASAIRLRENGWVNPNRPLVMLFLGSSGIGKTELAKQLAHYLDGSKDKTTCAKSLTEIEKSGGFVRIDMSEYQHDHTVSNLTGSPKGYVGYEDGGILTTKLKENPKAIVLLDEIEKAHPDVLTVFLQIFDDGRITDPNLGTIYCGEAVFVMTSNLGSEEIRAASQQLHALVGESEDRYHKGIEKFVKGLYPILKESFKRDEFLGRINQTVVFMPFNDKEIKQIIELELKKWQKRADEQHAIGLSWSPQVVNRLALTYDVNYGARSVINAAHKLAINKVAESQIRGDIDKNCLVHLFINDAGDIKMWKGKSAEELEELERKKELECKQEFERLKMREEELCKRYTEIENIIGDKIVGQRGPIHSISSAIRLRENGWVNPNRPLVMLFLGSSGVGKTELAKQVAYYLHGNGNEDNGQSLTEIEKSGGFVRIDMSEYQHSCTVSNLTGSPKGHVGYNEGGILTTKLKKNPKAIVLLDEIEKAHPDVLTVLLQIFDDGRITDPKLGIIHCEGAVFIMTSNLGSEKIRAASQGLHALTGETQDRYRKGIEQFNRGLYPVLKNSFKRDVFLGRINQTVIFLPFNDKEVKQIIEIELNKWQKRAEEQHAIRLSWSPEVVDKVAHTYDVNYGARSVINEVETLAIQKVAESQIRGEIKKNSLVHLFINDAGDIDMGKESANGRILQRGCHYVL